FPEGIMREPFSALGRADIIVITKSDMAPSGAVTEITRRIRLHNAEAPVFTAAHRPSGLITVTGSRTGLETLKNKKVYAFAAIANPSHFRSVLASAGAEVVDLRKFRDHYVYNQKDIDQITKDAAGLDMITTEKDLVKLRDLRLPEKLFALSIEFSVENDFYEHIFNMINRT
ncbi:MAG: tetraacyldisaccharide 4'-kinase, partial [Nitrospirota bacterium]|nr:tetraacyldisaccharide 4'-kinase [Nitrospirota bacterium]